MKTLKFKLLNISSEDILFIESLQKQYSISFRKLFNNFELHQDKHFLSTLPIKNVKLVEHLVSEVDSFIKKDILNRKLIQNHIDEINENRHITTKDVRRMIRLKNSLSKSVCFGSKDELIKLSKGNDKSNNEKWHKSRTLPLCFYGNSARYGSNNFDLKNISKGICVFKYEDNKINLNFNTYGRLKDLYNIQLLICEKKLPVTVKLSSTHLHITFDEQKINGTYHDIKSFYKTIENIKNKDDRKKLIHEEHERYKNDLKKGKLDRYLAIDMNPMGIGWCILSKNMKIIDKGFYSITIENANKRRYETTIIVKDLFKLIKHYRCHTIIVEELDIKIKDHGNKISNKKINNLWNRNLIFEIIERQCNETGTLKIEVPSFYSSFIGNLMYEEYDPIAASIEIGRRGINKYSKGLNTYPKFCLNNLPNVEKYGIDVEFDKATSWIGLCRLFVTAKKSYRRGLDECPVSQEYYLQSPKSKVLRFHF